MEDARLANFIPLTEYSTKYRVSVSTLRRRIKAEDIRYRFDDGKYLLVDEPMNTHQGSLPSNRPSQVSSSNEGSLMGASQNEAGSESARREPVLAAANQLLSELKQAFDLILKEKEDQIRQLRQESADLKTWIRVLEQENEKMKRMFFEKWEQLPPSSSSSSSS